MCICVVGLFESRKEKLVFMCFQLSLPLFDRLGDLVWASGQISGKMFRYSDNNTVLLSG